MFTAFSDLNHESITSGVSIRSTRGLLAGLFLESELDFYHVQLSFDKYTVLRIVQYLVYLL